MKIMTFEETLEFLNVKNNWLRSAVFKKEIPYIKMGRLIRFDKAELEKMIKKNTVKPSKVK